MFINLIILGLATGYLVRSFLLTEKRSHEGPFKLPKRYVVFPETDHIQRAALFDMVRRAVGVYEVAVYGDGNFYWKVKSDPAERWTCPFCLSFWVSLPATILFVHLSQDLMWAIPAHFAISTLAIIAYGLIEGSLR
jgi:hypothetical protein